MGKHLSRNKLLAVVFWFKVFFSFSAGCFGLFWLSRETYILQTTAIKAKAQQDALKASPIVIDSSLPECTSSSSSYARLEPPNSNQVMAGFHLNWAQQTPKDISLILGHSPAI